MNKRVFTKTLSDGDKITVTALIRSLNNQSPYFSLTGDIRSPRSRDSHIAGCIHEEIAKHFPELQRFIKWHLMSDKEPMHYVANATYFASDKDCHGLRKGETRQIKNGKTGLPAWQLIVVDKDGNEVEFYKLSKYKDSETKPESENLTIEWRPWNRVGEGKEIELQKARDAAIWPDAKLEDFTEEKLLARLPALVAEYKKDMLELFNE